MDFHHPVEWNWGSGKKNNTRIYSFMVWHFLSCHSKMRITRSEWHWGKHTYIYSTQWEKKETKNSRVLHWPSAWICEWELMNMSDAVWYVMRTHTHTSIDIIISTLTHTCTYKHLKLYTLSHTCNTVDWYAIWAQWSRMKKPKHLQVKRSVVSSKYSPFLGLTSLHIHIWNHITHNSRNSSIAQKHHTEIASTARREMWVFFECV